LHGFTFSGGVSNEVSLLATEGNNSAPRHPNKNACPMRDQPPIFGHEKKRESMVVNMINMLPEWWIYHDLPVISRKIHGKMMMNHWSLEHSALPIP